MALSPGVGTCCIAGLKAVWRARPPARRLRGERAGCPGASHATPRASEEARVVTTSDEISLNYHSAGAGECSLSRSRRRARRRLCPGGRGCGRPARRLRQRELGAESAPSWRSPGERQNYFPRPQGAGEPEKKTGQNTTCTVRGLDSLSSPAGTRKITSVNQCLTLCPVGNWLKTTVTRNARVIKMCL